MTEFDVKKALSKRSEKIYNSPAASTQSVNGIPNSVLADVFSGKRGATGEMMGHREELAPSIASKMSQSFGMDFSAVQLYRSDAMAGTELHGMAQGNKVVLSSDVDLNTLEGQATLGHELSHIRAQSMGMGTGRSGLLENAALEHQADSEGMLAARGMRIGGESMGMPLGLGMTGMEGLNPIGVGVGASAAAPMQATKNRGGRAGGLTEVPIDLPITPTATPKQAPADQEGPADLSASIMQFLKPMGMDKTKRQIVANLMRVQLFNQSSANADELKAAYDSVLKSNGTILRFY